MRYAASCERYPSAPDPARTHEAYPAPMRSVLTLRRGRPLRVAVAGAAVAGGADGNARVWSGVLPELGRLARIDVVAPGGRPARRPDVWLAAHQPLPGHEGAPLVRVVHEASWVRADFRAVLTADELAWVDEVIRAAAASATRLLLPSRAGVAEVTALTGIDPAACDVVAYGHDPRVHGAGDAAVGRRLVDAAGAAGRPFVLFCGQAHPKKQLEVLRDSMTRLEGLAPALVVVAAPSHRPDAAAALAAAVAPLGADVPVVDLTTAATAQRHRLADSELAGVMAAAAALCLPSLGEGFGLPVLEAMACGCPVVVSDRGALPELVGDAGAVCTPGVEPVAAALRKLLAEPAHRDRMARAAAARARGLTWAATADGWRDALARAAEQGARGAEAAVPDSVATAEVAG